MKKEAGVLVVEWEEQEEEEEEEEMEVVEQEGEPIQEIFFSDINSIIESFSCVRNKQGGTQGQSECSLTRPSLFTKRSHHRPSTC